MALDPHREVAPDPKLEATPRLLRSPSDAPPRLEHMSGADPLTDLRRQLSYQQGSHRMSLTQTARFWAARITGRSQRHLLLTLGASVVALGERCDRLSDRLSGHEEVTEDVAATLGEELARLRAEVLHLKALTTALGPPPDD